MRWPGPLKIIKTLLWTAVVVLPAIGMFEGIAWGSENILENQPTRFFLAKLMYGSALFLYVVCLVEGLIREKAARLRFAILYHVRNVPLFVIGWIAYWLALMIAANEVERKRCQYRNSKQTAYATSLALPSDELHQSPLFRLQALQQRL